MTVNAFITEYTINSKEVLQKDDQNNQRELENYTSFFANRIKEMGVDWS
jgi:hypothetical protein